MQWANKNGMHRTIFQTHWRDWEKLNLHTLAFTTQLRKILGKTIEKVLDEEDRLRVRW